ncbi:hypothetical protein NQ318_010185 [Aromia moschata]|uniref:Dynein heavy chain 7, axonemal n=1 Tax=Aromia moschata TaxID=1265417 RepID=A0AAV8Y0U3_9CUCU|nr:hypothetical protein NQ318_010185 [Aromia moschata]
MDREAQRLIRQCKVAGKKAVKPPSLHEIVATQLTEEVMDSFNINQKKRKRLRQFQLEFTRKTKMTEFKTKLVPLYPEVPRFNDSHQLIRSFAEMCPTTAMSRFQEADIRKMIAAKGLEKKYANMVDDIIAEVRAEFVRITHATGVNLIALPLEGDQLSTWDELHDIAFTFKIAPNSKSGSCSTTVSCREFFRECVTKLPETLFDLTVFTSRAYELEELFEIFSRYVLDAECILHKFYCGIVDIVKEDKTKMDGDSPSSSLLLSLHILFNLYGSRDNKSVGIFVTNFDHSYRRLLTVCTGLLSVYISQSIMQSITHVIAVTSSEELIPNLQLSLKCKENLLLVPSYEEVHLTYSLFITNLLDVGVNFRILETYRIKNFPERYIHMNVTDSYVAEALEQIAENLLNMFEPVNDYVSVLGDEFKEIFKAVDINNADKNAFQDGCNQIMHYQNYINKASSMLSCEYFAIGQLILSEYVQSMKESLSEVIELIFAKLCKIHILEDIAICTCFQKVKQDALAKPTTSEELIEQGKYIIWVKTTHLHELRERIQKMLCNLTRLIDFGTITPEHMAQNAVTVNWLNNLDEILDINSSMYEQIKFEHEEALQKTIAFVNNTSSSIGPMLEVLDDMDDFERAREYVNQIKTYMVVIKDLRAKIVWIKKEQEVLGFGISPFKNVEDLENFVYPFFHLLKVCMNIKRHINVWLDGQFEFLNYEECEEKVEDYMKELLKIQKTYRIKLRQAPGENETPLRFFGVVDDPELFAWPSPLKLTALAIQALKDFRPAMVIMRIMCNDALMKRHWKEMSMIAGFDLTPNAGSSLRKLTMMGLEPDMDNYDVISSGATKERELFRNLQKMKAEWADINFKTSAFKDTGVQILTALDDVQVVLDDHILKALTMRGSIFVKPYESEVRAFYDRLVRINATIDSWGKVQVQYLYLLPIFSSKDIVAQMPEEGGLFREVNDTFKRYIDVVIKDPRVFETAGAEGVLEAMVHCCELLELINEGVTNYLEKKRLFFPRFFFLSNDEMLEILSETKNPLKVQPHLRKCFEAINTLEFDDKLQIWAMYSQENEKINFKAVINTKDAGGSVEKWLIQVEEQMVLSVRDQILKKTLWVQKWPGQVVLAVSQAHWTYNVHKALNNEEDMNIGSFTEELRIQLQEIVSLIRDPSLTNLARITIKALIVIDVHAKDVVESLYKQRVGNDKEFKWLSQMRYYLEDDECLVRIINATVKYAYEYLGNSDRLVITPLTDRCYRTLIGAYHLHLNGAPEGPAGTGKTETTKDLAKALAVQCVVFNCSDGLDYKAMGKFFKGLASCGAWVCFDEFNRIDIEVLSVVAQQILSIVLAVRGHMSKFNFEGTEIKLNPSCYVCITMNPGYAGRSELPDNLKVLFRTVAMMVPDYALIGEISFVLVRVHRRQEFVGEDRHGVPIVLGTVVVPKSLRLRCLHSLRHERGRILYARMRAVKSVLSAAGNNKRKFPNENEDILLLRSILDVNLPKFLSHDLPLFDGIISDLFPGVVLPQADYRILIEAMTYCIKKRNLQPRDTFITKVIQTYEMMIVRHGFMMVGYPFAGKTSTLRVLADTLSRLNSQGHGEEKVQVLTLNPKAITMGQLYGQFDPVSYEWSDGVVAVGFRKFAMDPCSDRKWIIFDGPVDAVWIENMNSVLDDNKKLCLMSGEVMCMTNSMSLIFEVMDLEQASPATVSRCGMIYLEPSTLGWQPFLESWIPNCNPEWCNDEYRDYIIAMFHWLVPPSLNFLRKHCVQYCYPGEISLVRTMMSMVEMLLDDALGFSVKKEEDAKYMELWIQATFLQAGVWGVAAIVDTDSRVKFDSFYKSLWNGEFEDSPYPKCMEKVEITIPSEGILLDYSYNYRLKGNWKYWPEIIRNERVDECKNILQALVPTVDTVRYMSLVDMHIRNNNPLLLMGPTGTGKSFYIQDFLMNKMNKTKYEPAFITFTVEISANQTQELVISKLNKKRRGHYGPRKENWRSSS